MSTNQNPIWQYPKLQATWGEIIVRAILSVLALGAFGFLVHLLSQVTGLHFIMVGCPLVIAIAVLTGVYVFRKELKESNGD